MRNGLLLINIGTPEKATKASVKRFLGEFLTDKKVIDLPSLLRYLLVYGLILPRRTKTTTKAYQQIWQPEGSPLLVFSEALAEALSNALGSNCKVALGMRYGKPSLASALKSLEGVNTLFILPLYPQYTGSATGSAVEKTLNLLSKKSKPANILVLKDFYQKDWYIDCQASVIRQQISSDDFLLFSYHGIPLRHLQKEGCQSLCPGNCVLDAKVNQNCYKKACLQTSASLANRLGLTKDQFASAFQSRLGKLPWLEPYTLLFFE